MQDTLCGDFGPRFHELNNITKQLDLLLWQLQPLKTVGGVDGGF